ncbi:Cytochrome c-type biogenesis protein CcdA (DsbD analog) [hydrothermal vent metagenome]|uniref:Cytochrome c-type biogenesis protein CcdA (DsbD analog) n=1 Tax=hydrothermal vent metagenome TaxID=652676 RepID=A0A3B0TTX8_9ZZZZ
MAFEITYTIALLAGLLSFLSPCVLPLVPPYLCYLGGTSIEEFAEGKKIDRAVQRRMIVSSLCFVAGFTTVFVTLGATASVLGRVIAQNLDILAQIAGVVIIVMGLHFLGLFKIPLLYREARYHHDARPAGLAGAYLIGVAFAFGWTPCIGPVLAAILGVAATQDSIDLGMALLAVYSLGLGIPFVLAAFAVKPFLRFMARFRSHIGKVEKVMGGALVLTGVLFITGSLNAFSFWLLDAFPALGNIEALVLGG